MEFTWELPWQSQGSNEHAMGIVWNCHGTFMVCLEAPLPWPLSVAFPLVIPSSLVRPGPGEEGWSAEEEVEVEVEGDRSLSSPDLLPGTQCTDRGVAATT